MAVTAVPLKPLVAWALLKPDTAGSLPDPSVEGLGSLESVVASPATTSAGELSSAEGSAVNPSSTARTPRVTSPMLGSGSGEVNAE